MTRNIEKKAHGLKTYKKFILWNDLCRRLITFSSKRPSSDPPPPPPNQTNIVQKNADNWGRPLTRLQTSDVTCAVRCYVVGLYVEITRKSQWWHLVNPTTSYGAKSCDIIILACHVTVAMKRWLAYQPTGCSILACLSRERVRMGKIKETERERTQSLPTFVIHATHEANARSTFAPYGRIRPYSPETTGGTYISQLPKVKGTDLLSTRRSVTKNVVTF